MADSQLKRKGKSTAKKDANALAQSHPPPPPPKRETQRQLAKQMSSPLSDEQRDKVRKRLAETQRRFRDRRAAAWKSLAIECETLRHENNRLAREIENITGKSVSTHSTGAAATEIHSPSACSNCESNDPRRLILPVHPHCRLYCCGSTRPFYLCMECYCGVHRHNHCAFFVCRTNPNAGANNSNATGDSDGGDVVNECPACKTRGRINCSVPRECFCPHCPYCSYARAADEEARKSNTNNTFHVCRTCHTNLNLARRGTRARLEPGQEPGMPPPIDAHPPAQYVPQGPVPVGMPMPMPIGAAGEDPALNPKAFGIEALLRADRLLSAAGVPSNGYPHPNYSPDWAGHHYPQHPAPMEGTAESATADSPERKEGSDHESASSRGAGSTSVPLQDPSSYGHAPSQWAYHPGGPGYPPAPPGLAGEWQQQDPSLVSMRMPMHPPHTGPHPNGALPGQPVYGDHPPPGTYPYMTGYQYVGPIQPGQVPPGPYPGMPPHGVPPHAGAYVGPPPPPPPPQQMPQPLPTKAESPQGDDEPDLDVGSEAKPMETAA